MDNRHAIDLIRALTASSALFIPSNTPYREILMEGVYSLSQLISLVNHSFFDPVQRNNRPLMHALNLITTVISNVEVFAEGVSNLCGSTAYKNFVVLIVEASKASCRLISMMSSQSNTMLLNWGKADNATSVQPDVSDYLAHYKSACDKILRNLHAKSPTLFQISSNRPVSFRLNSTAAASAMLSVSSVSGSYASPTGVSAASRTMLGNNGKTAAAAVDEKGNKEPFLGRRSGIQLNSTAFDSIPIRTRLSGTKLDNTSPASAATSQSASSDDNRCMSINTKDGINSDGVTSNTYSGANVTNNNAGSYSSISTRTTHYSSAEIIHEAVDSSIRNFSTTRYSASGRSSPEYKDNCPGTMHAPPPLLVGDTSSMDYSSYDYHNNGTPYNYGISSNPALFSSSGLTDNGSSNPNTPYLSTDYIISYNGTPYRARNTPLDADYSNASSAAKVALEFEPENEENTPSSADTSFDCEVVFTSIYSGSPGALQNTVANSGSSAAGATSIVEQDADTFQGENEHFKNNYLEQVTAPKSPERSDITSEKAGIFDSVEQNNDAADSGAPDASGAKFSMSSIFGTATTPTAAAMFELGADDALKLGEMLYILRPLIYAVLVHQIDQYRQTSQQQQQPQQPSDTDNGDQVSSSSGNSALVRAGGINGVVGRIAEYVTGARNSIVSRVLDCVSVDALLSALALAISFVIELLSIQLTQYALVTLRNKARDDTFIANIGTYLIPASSNNNHSIHSNQSNNSGGAAGGGLSSAGFPGSHVDSRSTSRMPQNAVTRKRVYDVYASESGKMAHRHAFDQELSRRRMALFLYLIRSPIFDRATYPLLKTVAESAKNIPLVGALPEYALGLLSYLNKMHFYNSNS